MSYKEEDILSKKQQDLSEAKEKLSKAKTAKDKEMYEARISVLEESIKKHNSITKLTTRKVIIFTVVVPVALLIVIGLAFLIGYHI